MPATHPTPAAAPPSPLLLNDVHSQLNPTTVASLHTPSSLDDLCALVRAAARDNLPISTSGGRHAMARQQFATAALHIDTSRLNHILRFDTHRGLIEAQAGILWPDLIAACRALESPDRPWSIAQKQTGADRLSLGGSISANIHGRGLTMAPLAADLEDLTLITPAGEPLRCSRAENPELFALAVGGYGLFGIISSATLRLVPRRTLRRDVEMMTIEDLVPALESKAAAGALYGDFQFAIDPAHPDFLRRGVVSCYTPVPGDPPVPTDQLALSEPDWLALLSLAHTDKTTAFTRYADHYLRTSGQLYHTDTHQLSTYIDDYHGKLAPPHPGPPAPATEIITELYVPRDALHDFMAAARAVLITHDASVVYGTVRLIEPDTDTFLPWARERYACIVLNLCTPHTRAGIDRSARALRALIDEAARRRGSFYLTYHAFATRAQIEECHPRFRDFLALKMRYDPQERFSSDWYRRHRDLFA